MGEDASSRLRFAAVVAFAACVLACQLGITTYILGRTPSPLNDPRFGLEMAWADGGLLVRMVRGVIPKEGGVQKGDLLVAFRDADGTDYPIADRKHLDSARRAIRYGEPFSAELIRVEPNGGERRFRLEVPALAEPPAFARWALLSRHLPELLFALICIATGLLIGCARPGDPMAFNASLLFLCVAVLQWRGMNAAFPPVLREFGLVLWILPFSVVTALYLRFFLLFPSPSPLDRRLPWLKRFALAAGLTFAAWNLAWHYTQTIAPSFFDRVLMPMRFLDWVQDGLYALWVPLGLVSLVLNTKHAEGEDERRRGRILLVGSAGFLPWLTVYVLYVIVGIPALPLWVYYTNLCLLAAFPLAFSYAVLRHRVFGIRVMLRRGLRFALLSRGVLVAEAVLVFLLFYFGAMPLAAGTFGEASPVILSAGTALLTALVVLGIRSLNRRVMPALERHFFREAYDARAILTELARSVRKLSASPEALFTTVTDTLLRSLHPDQAAVFLRGSELRRIPASAPAHRALARGKARENPGDFFCLWTAGPGWSGPVDPETESSAAVLSEESAVARRATECALQEQPEALEIYPDKARGWAATVLEFGSGEDIRFVRDSGFRLLVPLASGERVLGFLALGEKLSEEPYGREDRELLLAVAQQMADTLEYADLVREGQEQAILRREVEIAREVQERLLVQQAAPFPGLDYAGACRPARFVGGDYYDYIRCGESRLGFVLGDVSGKGVSAALLMAGLQAALRARADIHGGALELVVSEINRHMCIATDEGRFATLFYGVFDAEGLRLDYVNAGHNPPLLIRAASGDIEHLRATGPILGLSPESLYARGTTALQAGDLLVLYSDGVTEALDEADDFYGEERLQALVTSLRNAPADAIRDAVFEDLDRFAGERAQNDDITLVVVRVAPGEPKRLTVLDATEPGKAPSRSASGE